MNELKFEELMNLYFDREISVDELKQLKKELGANADLKREFKIHYRLHRAACSVLSNRESSALKRAKCEINYSSHKPSVAFGLVMAACFLILLTTTTLVIRDTDRKLSTKVSMPLTQMYGITDRKPDNLPIQENFSSQLGLAGLTSDIVPSDYRFSLTEMRALRQKEIHFQSMIEQMNPYEDYSTKFESSFIESAMRTNYEKPGSSGYWPAGFKNSLASFE